MTRRCPAPPSRRSGLAILGGHATRCALSGLRFRQGKWRTIRVDIGPARV
jgi:hypothetical protein